ncbi:MAG: hypothetical protein AB8E15_02470, partial [Bdellovibrionales bacterium]
MKYLILLLIFSQVSGANQFDDLYKMALKNDFENQKNRLDLKISESKKREALSSVLPSLSLVTSDLW